MSLSFTDDSDEIAPTEARPYRIFSPTVNKKRTKNLPDNAKRFMQKNQITFSERMQKFTTVSAPEKCTSKDGWFLSVMRELTVHLKCKKQT